MTGEEAKRRLLNIERRTPIHTREDARDFEALEMAIQALSQEPCDDAISRDAVLDLLATRVPNPYYENVFRAVDALSSVTHKSGKWDNSCTCSVCRQWRILESEKNGGKYKYCPNCGARMVEPQESEDKE